MAKTSDRTSARTRARQALAEKQRKRRERDERIEAAATRYFAAADAIERAQREAGEAIKALVDEGEPRGEIAELLGIANRDIKAALDTLSNDDTGDTGDTGEGKKPSEDVSAESDDSAHDDTDEDRHVA
ncbi:hypothetical protein [Dietzia cinnamea]|uniref:hypothetical protein n=1 Tax=Dietzia cinnamea TaxID=321318 RepID=UPI000D617A1F|nr:hypothetical protein [Dietzia cinnamea]MCT1884481.1 hypothetical protein [Dietzia cinnamea]MCT2173897.1 hypothetical protein [Dietzia cinnamea]PWD95065.1 hypothetical protein DEQ16_12830 [Dietzia maris]